MQEFKDLINYLNSEDTLQLFFSCKNSPIDAEASQLFDQPHVKNSAEYFNSLKNIKCSELELKSANTANEEILWLEAGDKKIPFSNRSSQNGEFRGIILKKLLADAKNDPTKSDSFWHKQNKLTLCENAYKTNPSPELEKEISKLKTGIERKKQLFAETQPETVIHNLEESIIAANNNSPRP